MQKVLVICGPTAVGKSDLAVTLAKKLHGEVISADSRQVYKGLDIGTGKITQREMKGIPHHMIDVISPKKIFTAHDFVKKGRSVISKIENKKLPIVCGGTGFYIDALLGNIELVEVGPNPQLRKNLEQRSIDELVKILQKIDPKKAGSIDSKNKVRLIRAIEIADAIGKNPSYTSKSMYDATYIGLTLPMDEIFNKIRIRLEKRFKRGMMQEVVKLHKNGLSWRRMNELGLEYRYISLYLQKKVSKKEMAEQLYSEICKYAKRQMTWFKKNKKIVWFAPNQTKEILDFVKNK